VRASLPGPPLSRQTSVTTLLKYGVNVALGVTSEYDMRNARFEIAWVRPRRLRAFIIFAEIFYNT
jgi:hypothetical protein